MVVEHHKIPKISPGIYFCPDLCQRDLLKLPFLLFEFGGAFILRRLSTLGNMFGILQQLYILQSVPLTELNFLLSSSAKQRQNTCSGSPPVYQDLSTHHQWSVKKVIVDLPITLKKKFEMHFWQFFESVGDPEQ